MTHPGPPDMTLGTVAVPVDDTADLLLDEPFHDDLAAELAARAPRRWVTRTTMALAAVALAAAAFAAGAQVQKSFGGTPSASAGANGSNGGGAAAGAGQQGGPGGRRGGAAPGASAPAGGSAAAVGPVTGTVKLVDGTTVYVQTADGQVVTVRTNGQTAVQSATPSTLSDLKAGATVTVEGQRNADTVTATKVTRTP